MGLLRSCGIFACNNDQSCHCHIAARIFLRPRRGWIESLKTFHVHNCSRFKTCCAECSHKSLTDMNHFLIFIYLFLFIKYCRPKQGPKQKGQKDSNKANKSREIAYSAKKLHWHVYKRNCSKKQGKNYIISLKLVRQGEATKVKTLNKKFSHTEIRTCGKSTSEIYTQRGTR